MRSGALDDGGQNPRSRRVVAITGRSPVEESLTARRQGMTRATASATLRRFESMTGINTPGSRIV
jgi:hypothetical protein